MKVRHLKHTPTFVDESLFGPKVKEATFVATWNERKKGEKKRQRYYLWDPSGGNEVSGHEGKEISLTGKSNNDTKRPSTALGISRSKVKSSGPVWKP